MATIKNILVVRLGGIGDVTVITPALKALRKLYPQSKISLMTNHYSAEVVRGAPYADELITFTDLFSTQSVFEFLKPGILYQLYCLVTLMLGRRFDVFISLHNLVKWPNVVKPFILSILSQAPVRAGFNTHSRGFFLNVKTPDDSNKHLMFRCLDVIKQLASRGKITYTLQPPSPEVWLDDKDREFAADFSGRNPTGLLVGIHPGGNTRTYATQCWPAERFARVADAIADKYKARILLTGSKADRHILDKITSQLKIPPLRLPEDISVKQLAAIIGRCNLFISNDTGPMHLAVAMKVPTIGIFGGGDFSIYGRYPAEMGFTALKKDLPCSPCYHKIKCQPPECLDKITMEEVLQAVDKQLKIINKNG
ncbi:MAG: glycosyltransferase family 9 protein [Planctomycetes bacterium]|nr:glycosyltransferase family 9 protein [Planctomycetota bacterium]